MSDQMMTDVLQSIAIVTLFAAWLRAVGRW